MLNIGVELFDGGLQLDAAASVLAGLKDPIVIAKVNADKYTRLARKYEIEYVFFIFFIYYCNLNSINIFV